MKEKALLHQKSKNALEIVNLSFGYSSQETIFQNISLSIKTGQFIGIIGPNGGGKSTFLKLVLGFLHAWSGHIRYFETDIYPKDAIAYVPQSLKFDKQFPITVIEVVVTGRASRLSSLWGRYSKTDYTKAQKALSQVGLLDIANRSFGTLSGGQAQRVLIARALASEPSILILDEPTASIDQAAEQDILQILHSLQGAMTILMVTHNLHTALSHVDNIICVQGGAVLMQPKEVCEHFALGLYHFPLLQAEPQTHLLHRREASSSRCNSLAVIPSKK